MERLPYWKRTKYHRLSHLQPTGKAISSNIPMLPLPFDLSGKSDIALRYKQRNKSQQSDHLSGCCSFFSACKSLLQWEVHLLLSSCQVPPFTKRAQLPLGGRWYFYMVTVSGFEKAGCLLPPLARYLCSVTRRSSFFKSWIARLTVDSESFSSRAMVGMEGQHSPSRFRPVHIDTDRLPLPGVAVPSGRENQACPSSFTSVDFVVWSIRLSRMLSSPLRSDLADLGAAPQPCAAAFSFLPGG